MAATASKTSRTNSIGNFYVDKVDTDVMRKYLVAHKIKSEAVDATLEGEPLAVALSLYFRETIDQEDEDAMGKCEICAGEGPGDAPTCPFCGIEGEEGETEAEDPTSTEKLAVQVEEDEPKKALKKKKNPTDVEKVDHVANKKKNGASTALATKPKDDVVHGVMLTAEDLDKSVERVIKLKSASAGAIWALGHELRNIAENKLWKLRVNAKGKAKYTSFDQFCEAEAKMSHTHAYSLIDIARENTEADVAKFGQTRLAIIMKAPPEARPALKEAAAKGTTTRALKKEVSKVRAEKGYVGAKPKHSAAGKKSAAKKAATKAKVNDKITVASIEGTKTVNLFAKPDSLRNIDWNSLKVAKTLGDIPFGRLELTNEVSIILSIVKNEKTGQLQIKATTRRDSAED